MEFSMLEAIVVISMKIPIKHYRLLQLGKVITVLKFKKFQFILKKKVKTCLCQNNSHCDFFSSFLMHRICGICLKKIIKLNLSQVK